MMDLISLHYLPSFFFIVTLMIIVIVLILFNAFFMYYSLCIMCFQVLWILFLYNLGVVGRESDPLTTESEAFY